jgi:PPOX class probable F420-dependent enzyme
VDERRWRAQVSDARVAKLATIGPDGAPRLVPICFAVHLNEIVSVVDGKPKTTRALARLANIERDPRVSLLVDHYDDDDWTRLWWVRVDGTARIVETGVEHTNGVTRLRAKYPQYSTKRPTGPVVVITATRWTGWSAS